jgi:hypothetical protein
MSDQTRDEGEPKEPVEDTSTDREGADEEAGQVGSEKSGSEKAPASIGAPPVVKAKGSSAPSEEKLNAPSVQTVGMLSVIAAATLVMWGMGRAACNYHEPGESLSPRAVALEARTRSPKDVALELSQRWLAADFDVAVKLVSPDFLPTIQKDKEGCSGGACDARKNAKPLSVADVLRGNPADTFVRVRTTGLPQGEVVKLYEVERIGNEWKVTRELDPKAALPPLKEPPPSLMPQMGGPTVLQPGQLPPGMSAPGMPPGQGPLLPAPGPTAAAPTGAAPAPVAPKAAAPAPAPAAPAPAAPAPAKP